MQLTFLSSSLALTKTYTQLPDGSIQKSSYPNVWEVTSINEECKDLSDLASLLNQHGQLGHCLLKGLVQRPLVKESRKDSTDRNALTDWLCLDIDGLPNPRRVTENGKTTERPLTVDQIMDSLGLGDVSYVLQWSGSQGIINNDIRCHIFILLTKPVAAPLVKQWLIQKNHEVELFQSCQQLTKTGNSLTWGLDITACQPDKLIYIAPPTLIGIKNPLKRQSRISLVNKKQARFDLSTQHINTTAQNKDLTDNKVLQLRELAGLPKRKMTYKLVGSQEVFVRPDECIATEIKQDRGFVYFNLNGGDSWAYYHPENNPEYIFNFKGEPVYLTRELLPAYWEQLKATAYRISSDGVAYLGFLERRSSTYWRGTYDKSDDRLQLFQAKTETMIRHFAGANGVPLGDNIPEWDMKFDPHSEERIDFTNRTVNTFERTPFMRTKPRKITKCPPTIFKVISHVLAHDVDATEHFINWLAFIIQKRDRTRTAWVLHGTQGTGKGVLMNKVLMPILGENQTVIKRAAELTEKWTDFVEGKLLVFIDEIQSSAFGNEEAGVVSNLKNFITEPTATIRRMNQNSYATNNYANWIFASNKSEPVSISRDDRRFNVGPRQPTKISLSDDELDRINQELQDFHDFLFAYPLDEDAAHTPLNSEARGNMIELSQTTSESTAAALQEGTMQFFIDQLPTSDLYKADQRSLNHVENYRAVICALIDRSSKTGRCVILRDELFTIFNYTVGGMSESPATFSRFLGHKQINIKPVKHGERTQRGILVEWADHERFAQFRKDYFQEIKTKV